MIETRPLSPGQGLPEPAHPHAGGIAAGGVGLHKEKIGEADQNQLAILPGERKREIQPHYPSGSFDLDARAGSRPRSGIADLRPVKALLCQLTPSIIVVSLDYPI